MADARVWWVAAVTVPVVVVGATVVGVVVPLREEISTLRLEAEDQRAANEVQVVENARLAERSAGLDALRAEADELRRRVPAGLDVERLSRELHERASVTGMTVSSFSQSSVEVAGSPAYVRVPLSVTFVGQEGWCDPFVLLALLQASPGEPYGDGHDLVLTSVQISSDEGQGNDQGVEVELSVRGYLVLSVEPPAPAGDGAEADEDLVS